MLWCDASKIESKNNAKQNMSSVVCALSVYSHFFHENVIFSVCAYIIFIMGNSISGFDAWYHFRFKISCGVAVMGRGHQKKNQVFFQGEGRGETNILEGRANF